MASTCASSPTSHTKACTRDASPHSAASVALARSVLSGFEPQMATLAPAASNARAMPRPMPPLPPVTTAPRPLRSKGVYMAFSSSRRVWQPGTSQRRTPVRLRASGGVGRQHALDQHRQPGTEQLRHHEAGHAGRRDAGEGVAEHAAERRGRVGERRRRGEPVRRADVRRRPWPPMRDAGARSTTSSRPNVATALGDPLARSRCAPGSRTARCSRSNIAWASQAPSIAPTSCATT